MVSIEEFVKFFKYQEALRSSSHPITAIAELGKTNTCLISSSSKWVIDSSATDHMTGNPSLFSTFQSHTSPSNVTLPDGSTSCVLGSGIVNPTPSLSLFSILSLLKFSFNLISMSRLTRALKYCVSFFPDHCLFQDLTKK